MIIGIDESGNFDTDQFSVSSAVYIRPKKAGKIQKVFEEWENSLPSSAKEKGEVKGWKLSNEQLSDFVAKVLIGNNYGRIRYTAIAIKTADEKQHDMLRNRKKMLIEQARCGEYIYREKSMGQDIDFCHSMAGWIQGLSPKSYAKFEVLCTILFDAFRYAPIAAKWCKHDNELGDLTISIDNTVIGPKKVKYWEKLLRDDFWNRSHHGEAFMQFNDWTQNHPFIKRFIVSSFETGEVEFTEELQKCWKFVDSKNNFEVRIADIVANILYRYYNLPSDEIAKIVEKMSTPRWCPYQSPICSICEFSDTDNETLKQISTI